MTPSRFATATRSEFPVTYAGHVRVNHPPYPSIGDEHLKALGLGLAGAHRTGKTTVAKQIAEKNSCPLVQVSLSGLANSIGVRIGLDMPFPDRVEFQEKGLALMERAYEEGGAGRLFVTDRTPLDLAAYVITAWHPLLATSGETDWCDDYVGRCIDATNTWLFQLGVVQPGIPWVDEAQKGENIRFYREALNTTIIGLCWDADVKPAVHIIDRDILSVDARVQEVVTAYSESISEYSQANSSRYPMQ